MGRVAQALHGSDNAFPAVERGDRVFVPVVFPEFSWFQDFNLRFVTKAILCGSKKVAGQFQLKLVMSPFG